MCVFGRIISDSLAQIEYSRPYLQKRTRNALFGLSKSSFREHHTHVDVTMHWPLALPTPFHTAQNDALSHSLVDVFYIMCFRNAHQAVASRVVPDFLVATLVATKKLRNFMLPKSSFGEHKLRPPPHDLRSVDAIREY